MKGKMKKPVKILLRILLIFVLVNIILALPAASFAEVLVLKSKGNREITTKEEMSAFIYEETGIVAEEFEKEYNLSEFEVSSTATQGYTIPVFVLHTGGDKRGFVVMAHGMNASHIGIYPEAQAFLEAGFDVWMPDERKFGESTWGYISYGYFEGKDVEDVLKFALEEDPDAGLVGLWGQSLGGAACENVMDTQVCLNNVDFIVLDCPMGAMDELTGAPKIQNRLAGVFNGVISGYTFEDQNPYRQMNDVPQDVLLILAENEKVIPKKSIDRIQNILSDSAASLCVFTGSGSRHANVFNDHPDEYRAAVSELINTAEKDAK